MGVEFICPGINDRYIIDVDDAASKAIVSGFGAHGDHNIWLDAMRKFRQKIKARFILSASFAAPLLYILHQRIFGIHNWGNSRDGKTATLHGALSVWGRPDSLKVIASSSETGIERTAALCTDLPLGISELETIDDNKKQNSFGGSLLYVLTEGKGRQRGTTTGLQETSTWRTILIMNGEGPIVNDRTKGGIITRVIEIAGGPFPSQEDKLFASKLYRITDQNHGYAGQTYMKYLSSIPWDPIIQEYEDVRLGFRTAYPNNIDAHLDAVAAISIADKLSSMWVFGEDEKTAEKGAIDTAEYIISQLVLSDEADDSERAWQWLQGWLASNAARFSDSYSGSMPMLGYREHDSVYIFKNELTAALANEGYNPRKILARWAELNRIPWTSNGNKKTIGNKGRIINGARPWIIKLCPSCPS